MIEREKINKENINSGTIPGWASAKIEEDNLVKECHEKSTKYMLIITLSCCFISIAQNIDLPRTNQTIWSQQTKKEYFMLMTTLLALGQIYLKES